MERRRWAWRLRGSKSASAHVIVTHRPQILAHVDRLLVMSLGTVLAFGPRDDVIARMRGGRVAAVETDTEQRAALAS